jgi:hypothetical protein
MGERSLTRELPAESSGGVEKRRRVVVRCPSRLGHKFYNVREMTEMTVETIISGGCVKARVRSRVPQLTGPGTQRQLDAMWRRPWTVGDDDRIGEVPRIGVSVLAWTWSHHTTDKVGG